MKAKSSVCFTQMDMPPSTEEKNQNLITRVLDLVKSGKIGGKEASGLIAFLDAAAEKLDQGKPDAAANILEGFVNKIEAMVKSGKLTPAEGVVLVKAALNVLVD